MALIFVVRRAIHNHHPQGGEYERRAPTNGVVASRLYRSCSLVLSLVLETSYDFYSFFFLSLPTTTTTTKNNIKVLYLLEHNMRSKSVGGDL